MKKEIIAIAILCVLLISGFTTVSGVIIRTDTNNTVKDNGYFVDVSSTNGNIAKWTFISYLCCDGLNGLEQLILDSLRRRF